MGDLINLTEERTRRSIQNALEYVNDENEESNLKGYAFVVLGRSGENMQGSYLEDMSKDAKLELIAILEMMKQSLIAGIE